MSDKNILTDCQDNSFIKFICSCKQTYIISFCFTLTTTNILWGILKKSCFASAAIIIFLFYCESVIAQSNNWDLVFSNGDTLNNVLLNKHVGDSLSIYFNESEQWINIDSIVQLYRFKNTGFWTNTRIGFASGFVGGALLGLATYEKPDQGGFGIITPDIGPGNNAIYGGLTGGIAGLIVGSIVDAITDDTENYYLDTMDVKEKLILITSILKKQ